MTPLNGAGEPRSAPAESYRDPVLVQGTLRQSQRLRWLSAMLLVKVPWADRVMALPFLTLLAPSKRFYADKMRAPKTLLSNEARLQERIQDLATDAIKAWQSDKANLRNFTQLLFPSIVESNLTDTVRRVADKVAGPAVVGAIVGGLKMLQGWGPIRTSSRFMFLWYQRPRAAMILVRQFANDDRPAPPVCG